MKNRYIIIPAVVIVALGGLLVYTIYTRGKQEAPEPVSEPIVASAESIAESSEPVVTPEPTASPEPTSTPEPTVETTEEPSKEINAESQEAPFDWDKFYEDLAERMGVTVEEARASIEGTNDSNSNTSSSSQDQSLANNNSGGSSSSEGEDLILVPGMAGDGGEFTSDPNDIHFNDSDNGEGDGTFQFSPDLGDGGEYTSDPNDIHFNP